MSNQFTTDQEAMQRSAGKVDEAAGKIAGHISTLRSDVETMLGGWTGDASGAFSNVHSAFESQANKINNALRQMHEALVATHQTYGTQESDQTQTFTGMSNQINS